MPSNYKAIADRNIERYGTGIDTYGPVLLSNRYGDSTHFIYELLQNAEDALKWRIEDGRGSANVPGKVTFDLYKDRLEVRHFGATFSEMDVKGICGLVESTKPENGGSSIGKFGIGFKSVYAFTKHPEIHSGDDHFLIDSYVRPRAVAARYTDSEETLFYLPFDHQDVSPDTAFRKTSERLDKLDQRNLLFLNHIDQIEWKVEGGSSGNNIREVKRLNERCRRVTLVGQSGSVLLDEEWLVFERLVLTGENRNSKVEIAFQLTKDADTGNDVINPLVDTKLVVFFATEKSTNLGFLLQGPFHTTPSRDNIPEDDDWNRYLITETQALVISALQDLRDMHLLNANALEALPLDESRFSKQSIFRPIFDTVKDELKQREFLPRYGGGYISGKSAVLARSSELRELLNTEQLQLLYNRTEPLYWITDDISVDRTPQIRDYIVSKLGVDEMTPASLATKLNEAFFVQQSDTWMIRFYQFLAGQKALWGTGSRPVLKYKPIIRLSNGRHVQPFGANNDKIEVYLPSTPPVDFPSVKNTLCEDEAALGFLKLLGVKQPDVVDNVITHVLPRYSKDRTLDSTVEQYEADLVKIVRAYQTDSRSQHNDLVKCLRDSFFVRCINEEGKISYQKPIHTYFHDAQLEAFFAGYSDAWYIDVNIPLLMDEKVKEMLIECCANVCLRLNAYEPDVSVEKKTVWRQNYKDPRCSHDEIRDLKIVGFDRFIDNLLSSTDVEARIKSGILCWTLLKNALALRSSTERDVIMQGTYIWYYYSNKTVHHFDACFVEKLKNSEWLTLPDGQYRKPSDICFSQLPDGFTPDDYLQQRLGFRPETVILLAREAGIDPEILDLIKQNKIDVNQLREMLGKLNPVTPTEKSTDTGVKPTPDQNAETNETKQTVASDSNKESSEHSEGSNRAGKGSSSQSNHDYHEEDTQAPGNRHTAEHEKSSNEGSSANVTPTKNTASTEPRSRMVSYLESTSESFDASMDSGGMSHEERLRIGDAGIHVALWYEKKNDRIPKYLGQRHEGYDIDSFEVESANIVLDRLSTGKLVRHIEVKGKKEGWDGWGVGMTPAEFRAAYKTGESGVDYYLYVVEYALDPSRRKLYVIHNPPANVTSFRFDEAWKKTADAPIDVAIDLPTEPPIANED